MTPPSLAPPISAAPIAGPPFAGLTARAGVLPSAGRGDALDASIDTRAAARPESLRTQAARQRAVRPLPAFASMLAACVLFSFMSLLAKQAMSELPWHEVATGRSVFGALTVWAFARARGASLAVHDRRVQWNRTVAGVCGICVGFFALSRLALGDAVTLSNLTPLMLAVVSRRMLGEHAGGGLAFAIALGFGGVALLAGAQLHTGTTALIPVVAGVLGAACSCLAMVFLRRLGPRETPEGVSFHFLTWSAVATFAIGLGHQRVPTFGALVALVMMGLAGGAAQVLMTRAYSLDKAARVSGVGYSGVVLSQILGTLVLHESPSMRQLAGAGLVVLSGAFLVGGGMREREERVAA